MGVEHQLRLTAEQEFTAGAETMAHFIYPSTKLIPHLWYTNFEKIHPFIDGNGRVGSLLFNFVAGTLRHPIAAPDVFGGINGQ